MFPPRFQISRVPCGLLSISLFLQAIIIANSWGNHRTIRRSQFLSSGFMSAGSLHGCTRCVQCFLSFCFQNKIEKLDIHAQKSISLQRSSIRRASFWSSQIRIVCHVDIYITKFRNMKRCQGLDFPVAVLYQQSFKILPLASHVQFFKFPLMHGWIWPHRLQRAQLAQRIGAVKHAGDIYRTALDARF